MFRRSLRTLLPIAALAAALAGCGVKGELDPPPDADPATVRDATAGQVPPREGTEPDRPFILDGLLN